MSKVLGVGIIGASAERGWAKISHVPAVQGLEGLKLVAVAAGDEEKARAAAKAFGAERGYAQGFDLIQDPAVDIVTVAVKVPDHRELVLAAIAAGKHVYCEWPLGTGLGEAQKMADAARAAKIHATIGLQMRSSAAVLRARAQVKEGRIGRLLSARISSATAAFGPDVESAMKFAEDPNNGVSLITIQGAHTFDLAIAVLGEITNLSALTSTQFPRVKIGDNPDQQPRKTSDHVFLQAQLASGAPIGIEVAGGRPPESPTHFQMTGTDGTLTIRGGAMRGVQSGRLRLFKNEEEQNVEEGPIASMPETAANVAGIYAMLRDDVLNGTANAPDFDHAVRLARFVDSVFASAQNGFRQSDAGWPTS